jgi:hypothetical protein
LVFLHAWRHAFPANLAKTHRDQILTCRLMSAFHLILATLIFWDHDVQASLVSHHSLIGNGHPFMGHKSGPIFGSWKMWDPLSVSRFWLPISGSLLRVHKWGLV